MMQKMNAKGALRVVTVSGKLLADHRNSMFQPLAECRVCVCKRY